MALRHQDAASRRRLASRPPPDAPRRRELAVKERGVAEGRPEDQGLVAEKVVRRHGCGEDVEHQPRGSESDARCGCHCLEFEHAPYRL